MMMQDVEKEVLAPSPPQQPKLSPLTQRQEVPYGSSPTPAPLAGRSEVSLPAPYQPL